MILTMIIGLAEATPIANMTTAALWVSADKEKCARTEVTMEMTDAVAIISADAKEATNAHQIIEPVVIRVLERDSADEPVGLVNKNLRKNVSTSP